MKTLLQALCAQVIGGAGYGIAVGEPSPERVPVFGDGGGPIVVINTDTMPVGDLYLPPFGARPTWKDVGDLPMPTCPWNVPQMG
jgi:hypothetical protein